MKGDEVRGAGPGGPVDGTGEPPPPTGRARVPQMVRAKVAGSGALLLIIAAYHGSGYSRVAEAAASLPENLAAMTGGLWLFFSWHLTVLGVAALLTAVVGRVWARPVLLFCAFVTAGDFA
ncbi:MAG: hypothetical protein R3325_01470, partial [Thermoanaerobaculia bacterium]|nr:hypothetical protein [Thermoanaerobaculia bacterium]